jgi:threonyl-tRNA synthetase
MEMMPSNAASLMRHHGQALVAERLDQLERALVVMAKIGDFVGFSPFALQENLDIPFLKIFEGFPLGISNQKIIRVVGGASHDKETLKNIAKKASYASFSHLVLAREMGFFEPMDEEGMWFWRPKAELLREQLLNWWRQEHLRQNFSLISSPSCYLNQGDEDSLRESHKQYFLHCNEAKIAEITWLLSIEASDPTVGLFSTAAFYADRAHLICPEEKLLQECISSLHFILKIPKILDFEFEIVLSVSSVGTQKARSKGMSLLQQALEKVGVAYTVEKDYRRGTLASIEVRFADSLGRQWTGPFLSVPEIQMPAGKGCMLTRSTFGSLERLTALLLEKRGGWLPLWLAPEQVRILVLNSKADSHANEVLEALKIQGIRATIESSEEKLKARLYKAILEKVPYVVLLGEREAKAKSLTVRLNTEIEEQNLTVEEFCKNLKVEIGSGNSELTN